MDTYASADELALHMGVLDGWQTAVEIARAEQLLADATGVIDEEVGQSLLRATRTVTLDGTGTERLLLPNWPVIAVASVIEIDLDGTETTLTWREDYTWSASGVLTRLGHWPCHDRAVRSIFTAGLDVSPADVKRICRRLAAAGWQNPAGADSESRGDHSVKWSTPGMQLTSAERDTLARYSVRP